MSGDVQFKMISTMQSNIKKVVNFDELSAGHNKRKIIQQVCICSRGVSSSRFEVDLIDTSLAFRAFLLHSETFSFIRN